MMPWRIAWPWLLAFVIGAPIAVALSLLISSAAPPTDPFGLALVCFISFALGALCVMLVRLLLVWLFDR